jgi:hypothetical protein
LDVSPEAENGNPANHKIPKQTTPAATPRLFIPRSPSVLKNRPENWPLPKKNPADAVRWPEGATGPKGTNVEAGMRKGKMKAEIPHKSELEQPKTT